MKPVNEIASLEELRNSYDWAEVFGEGTGTFTDGSVEAVPPGSKTKTDPVLRADVVKIIASVDGQNDEADWVGVFKMKDGRFAVCRGGCNYTGWDCRASNQIEVASSLEKIIRYGLSDGERLRLNLPLGKK